jgi:hypothetical protein
MFFYEKILNIIKNKNKNIKNDGQYIQGIYFFLI